MDLPWLLLFFKFLHKLLDLEGYTQPWHGFRCFFEGGESVFISDNNRGRSTCLALTNLEWKVVDTTYTTGCLALMDMERKVVDSLFRYIRSL